ncbi:serine hydrolase domain-containing protein [Chitinophaga sp. Hz27]|uniref:serine hydrolase domain-containing protein n=1 Tax=Chitinophaga sp. Hz27 TaxID=3347169 RepID=UPI0035E3803F
MPDKFYFIFNFMFIKNQFCEMYTRIFKKLGDTLNRMPDKIQVSIALVSKKQVEYHGMIRQDGIIEIINNHLAAFEIGSVTKAFTGHILAQLIIEKKVGLNDLAQKHLPFPLLNSPAFTLKHLAQHTAGLPRMPADFDTQSNFDKANPFKNYTEEQLITYLTQNLRVDSQPGETHNYSNLGAGLLSYIISKVEEKPFAAVVAERIFRPLKMYQSSFDISEVKTEMVRGIDEQNDFCAYWDGGILNGCLGIISTAEDLSKFAIMAYDCNDAAATLQATETFPINDLQISNLGWYELHIQPEGLRMQGLNGGTGGYGASLLINRKNECAVILLSNIAPGRYMESIYPLAKELFIELSNDGVIQNTAV